MNAVEEISVDLEVAAEGVGDRLRAAREARGLTVADIAQALKFSARQIEMIEGNAWAELPGLTFVRGCVRTYARYLQLDPGPLLRDLESANLPKQPDLSVPGTTRATLPTPGRSDGGDRLAVLAGLFVVLAAVAAYFLIPEDFWKSRAAPAVARGDAAPALPAAPPTPPAPAEAPAAVPPPVAVAAAATTAPAIATGAENPTPAAAVMPPPAEPPSADNRVRFEFTRASWVEVRDANGQLLHSQNNAAGTSQEVSGTLPMSIIIGDASGVKMIYKDKPVDLGAFTKPNSNVARLNIE